MTSSLLETALAYQAAGRSVLPIAPLAKFPSLPDPQEAPVAMLWKTYQTTPADEATIRTWFPNGRLMGVGIAGGPASGSVIDGVQYALEVLDIDDTAELLEQFIEAANWQGLGEVLKRMVHQRTPGGAGHFAYLCSAWQGNLVLARRPGNADAGEPKAVTLIETRGAGGQAVVAPTPPGIHPEHPERGYELVHGSWTDLPIITPDERQALLTLARAFNVYLDPLQDVHRGRGDGKLNPGGNRPGDWLNRTADMAWWQTLLEQHLWTIVHTRDGVQYWRRPGKDGPGWSATLGACGDYFYVFSSNADPFTSERGYSPFSAYALLEHQGNFQGAARALIPRRLVAEWPEAEPASPLIEQLVTTPDARLVFDAIHDLSRLTPKIWTQVKYAAKALLGERLDLTIVERDWQQARRQRPRGTPPGHGSASPLDAESAEAFAALVDAADEDGLAAFARADDVEAQGLEGRYRMTASGIWWDKPTKDGSTPVLLANFTARIIGEVIEDDGVETRRHFGLAATLHGTAHAFQVSAAQFSSMSWVTEQLGPKAILLPGMTLKDHVRAAVQIASTAIVQHHLFTHLGWRQVEARGGGADSADGATHHTAWVYLHSDGATSNGPIADVAVQLPDALGNFQLPVPKTTMAAEALVASLQMLLLAPPSVMVPLYGAIWRAPLGPANFSEHLSGQSGEGKTELAALAQQHYGPAMDARHVPATWESTENTLEMLAFHAKDALLLIDDFAPRGSAADVHRYHAKADRVIRGQGNRSGRGRLRPDGSMRPQRPPRGLILSTGEDIPSGVSLRARLAIVEVSPGMVDWEKLSACQRDAAEGYYAAAMRAFVQWLAQRYDAVQAGRDAERIRLRTLAVQTEHRRTPDLVANLALAWQAFLAFAYDCEVLSQAQCLDVWLWVWQALGVLAVKQQEHQAAEDPVRRYLELIKGALTAGLAHVKDARTEDAPPEASAWGWRREERGTGAYVTQELLPQGHCIGWLEDDRLYLQSDATFKVVQHMADQQHAPLTVSQRTMHRRLHDRQLLRVQGNRKQLTVTRHIGPTKHSESVLDISMHMYSPENSTFSTSSTSEPQEKQNQALVEVLFPAWYVPKQHLKQHFFVDADPARGGGAISGAISDPQTAPKTRLQLLKNQCLVLEVLKVLLPTRYIGVYVNALSPPLSDTSPSVSTPDVPVDQIPTNGIAVHDHCVLFSAEGVQMNIEPWRCIALEQGPDGRWYASFSETDTGWPLERCQKAPDSAAADAADADIGVPV